MSKFIDEYGLERDTEDIKRKVIDEFVKKVIECGMIDGYVDADLFMEIAEQIREEK